MTTGDRESLRSKVHKPELDEMGIALYHESPPPPDMAAGPRKRQMGPAPQESPALSPRSALTAAPHARRLKPGHPFITSLDHRPASMPASLKRNAQHGQSQLAALSSHDFKQPRLNSTIRSRGAIAPGW